MRRSEKVLKIREIFDEIYSDADCSLNYDDPHQLLVAVQLSAQCTDERVNKVTPELFKRFPTVYDFAKADVSEVEEYVKSCGFYRSKAKNIVSSSKTICEKFGGKIPDTMNDLLSLAGVGRKTANLILGDVYKIPALVIDTHAIRLTGRIGLTKFKEPEKIEFDLKKIVPDDYQIHFCHQLVTHGRAVCNARKPKCEICKIKNFCKYYEKTFKEVK